MTVSRNIDSFLCDTYRLAIKVLDNEYYNFYSSDNSTEMLFFGVNRDIKNFDISRLINSIESLIDSKKFVTNFSYDGECIFFEMLDFYNDKCRRKTYLIKVINDKKIPNRLDTEIKRLMELYGHNKKDIDRRISIYNKEFDNIARIAEIAYDLLEDYKSNKYYIRRLSKKEFIEIVGYIERHKREMGLNSKLYKKSITYNFKILWPIIVGGASIGSIVASELTNIKPADGSYNLIITAAVVSGAYSIFYLGNKDVRGFLKEGHAEELMNKFIKELYKLYGNNLESDDSMLIKDRFLKRINSDLSIASIEIKEKLLFLKDLILKKDIDFKCDSNRVFNILINEIESKMDIDIINEEYFYSCLELLGLDRTEIVRDLFIGYIVKDIIYIKNNRYENDIEDFYNLLELGRLRVINIINSKSSVKKSFDNNIDSLITRLEELENNIISKSHTEDMVAKLKR